MNRSLHYYNQLKNRYISKLQQVFKLSEEDAAAVAETAVNLFDLKNRTPFRLHGQLNLQIVSSEESPFKPRKYCRLVNVTLTHFTEDDIAYRQQFGKKGVQKLRQCQMIRMANEAASQGGLLSAEDFAYRIFNCGLRTISRDLSALAHQGIHLPLRAYADSN